MKMKHEPVRAEVGRAMAEKIGAVGYLECSARTKEGCLEFFSLFAIFCFVLQVFEKSLNLLLVLLWQENERARVVAHYSDPNTSMSSNRL